jgi:hypothetical protein
MGCYVSFFIAKVIFGEFGESFVATLVHRFFFLPHTTSPQQQKETYERDVRR